MNLISFNELPRREAEVNKTGSTMSRLFQLITDEPADSPDQVLSFSEVPGLYSSFPGNANYLLTSKRASPIDHTRLIWEVVLSYETGASSESSGQGPDPISAPTQIRFAVSPYMVVAELAYQNGDKRGLPTKPILNSAHCIFDPPLMRPKNNLLITIDKNVSSWSPLTCLEYQDTVNRADIVVAGLKIGKGTGLIKQISADSAVSDQGKSYYRAHYELEISPEGHAKRILDSGFYAWDAQAKKHYRIVDKNKQPYAHPVLLKNGLPLADPSTASGTESAGLPGYLTFDLFWQTDWSKLDLPKGRKG